VCSAAATCNLSPAPDADGDGICDPLDFFCIGPRIEKARLRLGPHRLVIKGEAPLGGVPFDPLLTGIGYYAASAGLVNVNVPGGAYVPATRSGWSQPKATVSRYRDANSRVAITTSPSTGIVRFAITSQVGGTPDL
jgi:hypothetical protein